MPNEPELQVDALDYEIQDNPDLQDTGDALSGLEQDLSVSGLDSLESDNETGTLNNPLLQIYNVSPEVILAAGSIIKPEAQIMNVIATIGGGAITLTSNPSIAIGINGQILILRGSSATDTITITDGNGVLMAGDVTLGLDDTITFYFDGLVNNKWIEIARNLNTVQTYTPTNVTTDRSYDADTVVVAELADVVGTLIADLRKWGIIK